MNSRCCVADSWGFFYLQQDSRLWNPKYAGHWEGHEGQELWPRDQKTQQPSGSLASPVCPTFTVPFSVQSCLVRLSGSRVTWLLTGEQMPVRLFASYCSQEILRDQLSMSVPVCPPVHLDILFQAFLPFQVRIEFEFNNSFFISKVRLKATELKFLFFLVHAMSGY